MIFRSNFPPADRRVVRAPEGDPERCLEAHGHVVHLRRESVRRVVELQRRSLGQLLGWIGRAPQTRVRTAHNLALPTVELEALLPTSRAHELPLRVDIHAANPTENEILRRAMSSRLIDVGGIDRFLGRISCVGNGL